MTPRVIAVDWSGRKSGAEKHIWLAEVVHGSLIRLKNGLSRDKLVDHLIDNAKSNTPLIVGLDFAFSFPAWFVTQHGCSSAREFWTVVEQKGEQWLSACPFPFWRRKGAERPDREKRFRRTEHELPNWAYPKSVFQIVGRGQVGPSSLRGIPVLRRLREAGFSIWPFDRPARPRVVEIYPRLFTREVNKSSLEQRAKFLAEHFSALSDSDREKAASNEDAFDAAVSALMMVRHVDELVSLTQTDDSQLRLEGKIWY